MLEDLLFLQNQLFQQGMSINDFDESDYFEMLEGMNARAREDRPQDMADIWNQL